MPKSQAMLRALFHPRPCGSLLGIPIRVAPAVFVLVLLAVVFGGNGAQPGIMLGLLFLLATALLVHELAHALVAQQLGLRVLDITVWPLGGMARMEGLLVHPQYEAKVAVAGPAVNLFFGLLFSALPGAFAAQAAWVHFVLGLGNLLPAFPLDGGRILRAWLARRSPLVDATFAATQLAKTLSFLALFVFWLAGAFWIGLLLALHLWWSGQAEFTQVLYHYGRPPVLSPAQVWQRACYPWFSSNRGTPPSVPKNPTQEELERFHGRLDQFFKKRRTK